MDHSLCDVTGIGIDIYNNPKLEDLSGFESLTEVDGDLILMRNGALKTTAGLEGIRRVHLNLVIAQNPVLEDLSGLKNIKEVGGLIAIQDNALLEDLVVRDSLTGAFYRRALFAGTG